MLQYCSIMTHVSQQISTLPASQSSKHDGRGHAENYRCIIIVIWWRDISHWFNYEHDGDGDGGRRHAENYCHIIGHCCYLLSGFEIVRYCHRRKRSTHTYSCKNHIFRVSMNKSMRRGPQRLRVFWNMKKLSSNSLRPKKIVQYAF